MTDSWPAHLLATTNRSRSIFYVTDMNQLKRDAGAYAGYFFALACGIMICVTLQQWSFGVMGHRLARRIRVLLFQSILRQDIG